MASAAAAGLEQADMPPPPERRAIRPILRWIKDVAGG
jgi:hypothetical protein